MKTSSYTQTTQNKNNFFYIIFNTFHRVVCHRFASLRILLDTLFFQFFLSISRMVNEQQNIINLNNKHVKLILSELYINTWFNFSKIFIKIQQKKIVWISKKKTSR
jgi:hypothetical protein